MKEDAEHPIPRTIQKAKTRYTIVSLPENLVVTKGFATRSISADLDPGHYRVVCWQMTVPGGNIGAGVGQGTLMKWRKDFYHDCTPEQHTALKAAPLRFTKGMMTSDGTRYHCQLPGCDVESSSRTAAVLHEGEHSGVNLFEQHLRIDQLPTPKVDVEAAAADIEAERQAKLAALRAAALEQ
jgi:hypothetical protein